MKREKHPAAATSVESSPDQEQARLALLERLKGSAISTALTLLSVIQGVALADLGSVVSSNYLHFGPVQWLLVAANFLVLIAGWNQITMETLTWAQLPNTEGNVLPFLVGAFELFLNHALALSIQVWLIGAAVMTALSTLGIWNAERAAAQNKENAVLIRYLRSYRRAGILYNLFGAALMLLLALAGGVGWLTAADQALGHAGLANLVAALLAIGWLLGFLQQHFSYWRMVRRFARNGEE